MRQWLSGETEPMRRAVTEKKSAIQIAAYNKNLYVETNHCFIKGFGWELMHHLPQEQVTVIVLERPASEVAKSFYKMGVSPLGKRGHHWLIPPQPDTQTTAVWKLDPAAWQRFERATRLSRIYDGFNRKIGRLLPDPFHNYKITLLEDYVAHLRQLTERFFETFPQVTRINATLPQLNQHTFIAELCEKLGVGFTKDMERKVGVKRNERSRGRGG